MSKLQTDEPHIYCNVNGQILLFTIPQLKDYYLPKEFREHLFDAFEKARKEHPKVFQYCNLEKTHPEMDDDDMRDIYILALVQSSLYLDKTIRPYFKEALEKIYSETKYIEHCESTFINWFDTYFADINGKSFMAEIGNPLKPQ